MNREEHLKAIRIVGAATRGKTNGLVMMCSGPTCGGAEMFARRTAADVAAEAGAHIDKMDAEDVESPFAELHDLRALFALQQTRMEAATARWRAEDPEARALTLPDLGALLRWLMDDADRARGVTAPPITGRCDPHGIRWCGTCRPLGDTAPHPCCQFHDADSAPCAPDDLGGYCCDACPTLAGDAR